LATENTNLENYQKLALENKNEVLNNQGINESQAKFYTTIESIEFADRVLKPAVHVIIKFGDQSESTRKQNSGYQYGEMFTFAVKKKEMVYFELMSDKTILGRKEFHLNTIESQNDHELNLVILNEGNENIATLICKVKFIWSYFALYQNLISQTEKLISSFKLTLSKSKKIIDTLNGKAYLLQFRAISFFQ
jgi:hypothetical protein